MKTKSPFHDYGITAIAVSPLLIIKRTPGGAENGWPGLVFRPRYPSTSQPPYPFPQTTAAAPSRHARVHARHGRNHFYCKDKYGARSSYCICSTPTSTSTLYWWLFGVYEYESAVPAWLIIWGANEQSGSYDTLPLWHNFSIFLPLFFLLTRYSPSLIRRLELALLRTSKQPERAMVEGANRFNQYLYSNCLCCMYGYVCMGFFVYLCQRTPPKYEQSERQGPGHFLGNYYSLRDSFQSLSLMLSPRGSSWLWKTIPGIARKLRPARLP